MPKPLTPEERARQRAEGAKTFLADVFRKIPEDKREQVAEVLQAPDVLEMVGQNLLRQQEFSRFMDAGREQLESERRQVVAQKASLDDWWTQNSAAVSRAVALEREVEDLRRRMGSGGTAPQPGVTPTDDDFLSPFEPPTPRSAPAPAPTPAAHKEPTMDPSRFVTRDALSALAQEAELNQLKLTTMITQIGLRHSAEFSEVLDVDDLIQYAQDSKLPLPVAYDQYVRERREAKTQQQIEERIRQAREEGEKAGRAAAAAIPYPVSGQGTENIFAHIKAEKGPTTVAEMAAELTQMIAENR